MDLKVELNENGDTIWCLRQPGGIEFLASTGITITVPDGISAEDLQKSLQEFLHEVETLGDLESQQQRIRELEGALDDIANWSNQLELKWGSSMRRAKKALNKTLTE